MKNNLLILFCCTFLITSTCIAGEQLSLKEVAINLNSTKSNGRGWDAFRNAPDIALCIVTEEDDACYVQTKTASHKIVNPLFKGKKQSLCPNTYSCTFEVNKQLVDVLGLVILDLDTKNNDFVDAAIIANPSLDQDKLTDKIKKMDKRLRNISYKYAQVFNNKEKQRRSRKFTVCKLSKDNASKCKLTQSKLEVN